MFSFQTLAIAGAAERALGRRLAGAAAERWGFPSRWGDGGQDDRAHNLRDGVGGPALPRLRRRTAGVLGGPSHALRGWLLELVDVRQQPP
jgi:hypothetical protein